MNKQSGFTLIELVVVIVILGVLAATAVPRFAAVTDDARLAVAQGAFGAVLSSAVIQLSANNGTAQSFANIITNTDVSPGNDTIEVSLDGAAFDDITTGSAQTCAGVETLSVRVGGATGQTHAGTLPDALCDG